MMNQYTCMYIYIYIYALDVFEGYTNSFPDDLVGI